MEIEVASSYITALKFPENYRNIPSFLTFTHNYIRLLNFLSKISIILILFWIFFINFLIAFSQLIFFLIKVSFYKRKKISGEVYLDLSDSKYLHSITTIKPDSAIYFDKVKKTQLPLDIKLYNYFSIIKFRSIVKAFLFSIFIPYYFIYKKSIKTVLYTYSSFQWFLLYITLKENKISRLWISNHYDRYVKLVDSLDLKYNIIQHGQLFFQNEQNSQIIFPNFSEGLNNCSKIYMFEDDSRFYFNKYISSNYEIQFIKSPLTIKNYTEINKNYPTLLIIGIGPYVNLHYEIINNIYINYCNKINIVYRFHPTQAKLKFDTPIALYNDDKFYIPYSDIVYTYGSSIDLEIKKLLPDAEFVKNKSDLYSLIELKIKKLI